MWLLQRRLSDPEDARCPVQVLRRLVGQRPPNRRQGLLKMADLPSGLFQRRADRRVRHPSSDASVRRSGESGNGDEPIRIERDRAVVVAQLVERWLLTPEIRVQTPSSAKSYVPNFLPIVIYKRRT